MKRMIFLGILIALILTIGDCLAQSSASTKNYPGVSNNDLEYLKSCAVVKFTMSVNGKISDVKIDKGDGMGFLSLSDFNGVLKPTKIRTEADLINYMLDFDYRLIQSTVLNGKNQLYQFSVFEKIKA